MAVRSGLLPKQRFPEPAHAIIKAKLAKDAWRGNQIVAYLLEKDYGIPVRQLLDRTEPELSEIAGTLAQYLRFICEEKLTAYGLGIKETESGHVVEGTTQMFYATFIETGRWHNLPSFFGNTKSIGTILARESDALEVLGWRRSLVRITRGQRYYRFEFVKAIEC